MKKAIKRAIVIAMCFFSVMFAMSSTTLATSKTSGKCGKKAKWSYNKKKHTLTISGKGAIYDMWLYENDIELLHKDNLTIVIKNGITEIGERAFDFEHGSMRIKKITFPNSLKRIGHSAFSNTWLPSTITIPKNVKQIGSLAFSCSWGLKTIKVDKKNKHYASVDGVLFNKSKTNLIHCPSEKQGDYSVPDGTKTIEEYAFYHNRFEDVDIPDSVEEVYSIPVCDKIKFKGHVPTGLYKILHNTSLYIQVYFPKTYYDEWKRLQTQVNNCAVVSWYYYW